MTVKQNAEKRVGYVLELKEVERILIGYKTPAFIVLAVTGLLSASLAAVLPQTTAAIPRFI